jgi:hypothetical protein
MPPGIRGDVFGSGDYRTGRDQQVLGKRHQVRLQRLHEIVETHMDGNQAYLLSSWTVKQVKADGAAGSMSGHTLLAGEAR